MANPWAGEVEVTLDGQAWRARLTLGALAELEAELGEDSLPALVARFEGQAFRARDVILLLAAGLRGGGWGGSAADLGRAEIAGGPVAAARAAAALLALAFAGPEGRADGQGASGGSGG